MSRYDHFKGLAGVIDVHHFSKKFNPQVQLVLAGGGAQDGPEEEIGLSQVKMDDPNIHTLFLPAIRIAP